MYNLQRARLDTCKIGKDCLNLTFDYSSSRKQVNVALPCSWQHPVFLSKSSIYCKANAVNLKKEMFYIG